MQPVKALQRLQTEVRQTHKHDAVSAWGLTLRSRLPASSYSSAYRPLSTVPTGSTRLRSATRCQCGQHRCTEQAILQGVSRATAPELLPPSAD